MKSILNKIFRYRITSIYFIVGQIVLYFALFAGLQSLNKAYDKQDDAKSVLYSNTIKAEITSNESLGKEFFLNNCDDITEGNILISENLSLPVSNGKNLISEVILCANEKIKYSLINGRLPGSDINDEEKRLVALGRGHLDKTYEKEGKRYIDVCGESYEVIGLLGSYKSDYYDYKLIFHIKSLGENTLNKISNMSSCKINIVSDNVNMQESYNKFYQNTILYNNRIVVSAYKMQKNVNDVVGKVLERENIKLKNVIYLFCIVNCIIISEYWILQRRQEIAVRKVCGFSTLNIFWTLFKDVILMSITSLVMFLVVYLPYNFIKNGIYNISRIINISSLLIVAASILTVSLITMFIPMKKVIKMNASDSVML